MTLERKAPYISAYHFFYKFLESKGIALPFPARIEALPAFPDSSSPILSRAHGFIEEWLEQDSQQESSGTSSTQPASKKHHRQESTQKEQAAKEPRHAKRQRRDAVSTSLPSCLLQALRQPTQISGQQFTLEQEPGLVLQQLPKQQRQDMGIQSVTKCRGKPLYRVKLANLEQYRAFLAGFSSQEDTQASSSIATSEFPHLVAPLPSSLSNPIPPDEQATPAIGQASTERESTNKRKSKSLDERIDYLIGYLGKSLGVTPLSPTEEPEARRQPPSIQQGQTFTFFQTTKHQRTEPPKPSTQTAQSDDSRTTYP